MHKSQRKKIRETLMEGLEGYFDERAADYKISMVFLYGSWARGLPREDSDVDIGVVFDEDIGTETDIFETISEVTLDLARLLKNEVNLVPVQVKSWKPMFYYNILVLGTPIYVKSPDLYSLLRWQAISQMEDFQIFGVFWQLLATRRNLKEA